MLIDIVEVLEDSGIAWPNPGMWYQPPHLYSIPSPRTMETLDPSTHGHSPCHVEKRYGTTGGAQASENPPLISHGHIPPMELQSHEPQTKDPYWSPTPPLPDPFVDNEKQLISKKRIGRLSSEDQLMLDYSRSITPASSRNLSSHTAGPNTTKGSPPPEESQFEELMAAFSPHEDTIGRAFTSAHTRAGNKVSSPPTQPNSSTTPETRISSCSYVQNRSASVTTQELLPILSRRSPNESPAPYSTEFVAISKGPSEPNTNMTEDIKERMEGRTSYLEFSSIVHNASSMRPNNSHERNDDGDSQERSISASDAKRKRGNRILCTQSAIRNEAHASPSPSRKFSKIESKSGYDSDNRDDIPPSQEARSPLAMLENVH